MASSSTLDKWMIALESSDGRKFEVESSVVTKWKAIMNTVYEMKNPFKRIQVKNVTGDILAKVLEYSEKHAEFEASAGDGVKNSVFGVLGADSLKSWDTKFFKAMPLEELDAIAEAAKSVGYEELLDVSWEIVTETRRRKQLQEMLSLLPAPNDSENKE